jgi:hypothetical protein
MDALPIVPVRHKCRSPGYFCIVILLIPIPLHFTWLLLEGLTSSFCDRVPTRCIKYFRITQLQPVVVPCAFKASALPDHTNYHAADFHSSSAIVIHLPSAPCSLPYPLSECWFQLAHFWHSYVYLGVAAVRVTK